MTRTVVDVNAIYEDATTCVCGALVEEIDSGNGHRYWLHVKRMRIEYDHAAVPVPKGIEAPRPGFDEAAYWTEDADGDPGGPFRERS